MDKDKPEMVILHPLCIAPLLPPWLPWGYGRAKDILCSAILIWARQTGVLPAKHIYKIYHYREFHAQGL